MRRPTLTRFVVLLVVATAACSDKTIPSSAPPPATRIEPVAETVHGTPLVDNYRWLEGDNSDPGNQGKVTPEVAGWTDAQNSYTRSVLDNLPGRKALEDRLPFVIGHFEPGHCQEIDVISDERADEVDPIGAR
jgi:hypothetical protein